MDFLVATDGSADGFSAVHLGARMAQRMNAQVTLLCATSGKRYELASSMNAATDVMRSHGVVFSSVARHGDLVEEILGQMLDTEYDLVIVGYETRGFLEKMIWGSWATRIAHEVPTSVLIIRDRRDMINHVLVGISGGGFTEACVAWAGHIATAFDAQVTLVHTSQMPALMYGGLEEVRETLTEFLQTDTAEAHAMKQAVARLDDIGARTEVKLVYGLPERELLRLMQDLDIDLLVIGSWWAAQPVRRAVLRNIAEKLLLHTRRPVLVVRPPTV